MPFQKGQSGNPAGKPKGTLNRDTRNYVSLNYWYQLIAEKSEGMDPEKVVEIAFRAANMILSKVQTLPASPSESVKNAEEQMAELEAKKLASVPVTP